MSKERQFEVGDARYHEVVIGRTQDGMGGVAMQDLWGRFELLMKKAGAGPYQFTIDVRNNRLDGSCTHWPWSRVITLSQGAIAAGQDVAWAILAHEVAHTRQRLRWIIPVGAMAILGAGWWLGAPEKFIAPAGIWLLAVYQLYELDADRWAAAEVGAENMARMLQRLGLNGRWRAWMIHRRAERQRAALQ